MDRCSVVAWTGDDSPRPKRSAGIGSTRIGSDVLLNGAAIGVAANVTMLLRFIGFDVFLGVLIENFCHPPGVLASLSSVIYQGRLDDGADRRRRRPTVRRASVNDQVLQYIVALPRGIGVIWKRHRQVG